MQWALVLYSLTFLHANGAPMVSTFHPADSKVACLAAQDLAEAELRRQGYIALCMRFQATTTPHWPWRPDWRPDRRPWRAANPS